MKILITSTTAILAACLLSLAACGDSTPDEGRIVVGKSIAGVTLGMSDTQLRERLGAPDRIEDVHRDRKPSTANYVYEAGMLVVRIGLDAHQVVTVTTTDTAQKTTTGVGVGSSKSEVVRLVTGASCYTSHCYVANSKPGMTTFELTDSGTVASVQIGFGLK